MTQRLPRPQRLTKEEYLELEKQTNLRFEYLDGFVYAMSGESKLHNDLVNNLVLALLRKARAKGCQFKTEGIKTFVFEGARYYYPDAVLSCAEESDPYEMHRPCFIVEVLSPSTQDRDRREKLEAYTRIPTLERYILISQSEKRVALYQRRVWNWTYEEVVNTGDIEIPCLNEMLTLEQIYQDLEVPDALE